MKINHRKPKMKNSNRPMPHPVMNIKANFRHRDRGIHGGAIRI